MVPSGRSPASRVVGLDHVQLAMPPGREHDAEAFYCGVLGFEVVPKPDPLAARGGRWFTAGGTHLHLGVENDFRPARKAHPALVVDDLGALIQLLQDGGWAWQDDTELPGVRRGFTEDPFGNRIEVIGGEGPAGPPRAD